MVEEESLEGIVGAILGRFRDRVPKKHRSEYDEKTTHIKEIIKSEQGPAYVKEREKPMLIWGANEISGLPIEWDPAQLVNTGSGGGLALVSEMMIAAGYKLGANIKVLVPNYRDIYIKNYLENHSEGDMNKFSNLYQRLKKHPNIKILGDLNFKIAKKVWGGDEEYGLQRMNLRRAMDLSRLTREHVHDLDEDITRILHLNEWPFGPAVAGLTDEKIVFTFHNLYSFSRTMQILYKHGVSVNEFHKKLHYGTSGEPTDNFIEDMYRLDVDFLASALTNASLINSVSYHFLLEVINGEHKFRQEFPSYLTDIIIKRHEKNEAFGILNCLPPRDNPEIDTRIKYQYGTKDLMEGKARNKEFIQREFGLEVDSKYKIGLWQNRLQKQQKHGDLFVYAIPEMMKRYENLQLVIVADGEDDLIKLIEQYEKDYPGRIVRKKYTQQREKQAIAGADFLFMCPDIEPCGLPQFMGLVYGTRPIVYQTGGLKELKDYHEDLNTGNAHIFKNLDEGGILFGLDEAMKFEKLKRGKRKEILQKVRDDYMNNHSAEMMFLEYDRKMYKPILGRSVLE